MTDEVVGADGPRCPRCGGPSRPLAFGLPGDDLFAAAERGEVVLGGCVIDDDPADRACPACGHWWRTGTG